MSRFETTPGSDKRKPRRRGAHWVTLPLVLVAMAPALMGQETCTTSPSSIDVQIPAPSAVVATPVFPVTILIVNADETTLSVTLDGNDVTSAFTKTNLLANTSATGKLTAGAGPHSIVATVHSSKGTSTGTSAFQSTFPAFFSPDDVVTGAVPVGMSVTVRGTIKGASHTTVPTFTASAHAKTAMAANPSESFAPGADRYALYAITQTAGLTLGQQAWGVGAKLSQDQWQTQRIAIPYPGDVVEVDGTVTKETIQSEERFVLAPITRIVTVSSPNTPMKDIGESCIQDTECRDDLICDRSSLTCSTFNEIGWGDDPRGVNGACSSDTDCATGFFCDPAYTIIDTGTFGVTHSAGRDTGRHICRLTNPSAAIESICPRTVTTDDVASGRFKQGKELCVHTHVHFPTFNPGDNDVHVQTVLTNPYAYPTGDPPVTLVGHAEENAPPYRDPANPTGRIDDPPPGQDMIAIGTVKYDDGHEWYELHPIQWWRAVTP